MIFVKENPNSILAERYRKIRTSIEYSSVDKKLKSIVISSSESKVGKSTVASNLAYILSQSEKKVVLIDCDLRRPTIHKKFELQNQIGLTEYLLGKASLEETINTVEKNLDVITSGKISPNPAEVVSSNAMQSFMKFLKKQYDYVIIDTPPVLAVTDAVVLAKNADGTIFVVRANQTKDVCVKRGIDELKKVDAKIIGTIMNAVEYSTKDYGYYDYGQNGSKRNKKSKRSKKSKKDKKNQSKDGE